MSEKIVLIDGHSILNRAFYGIPELTNSEGLHTNAVYGFLNILFKILDEEKAQYLAVAFDLKAPTFRHKMYAEYKGTRKAMPEELREQVPVMKEVLSAMGVPLLTGGAAGKRFILPNAQVMIHQPMGGTGDGHTQQTDIQIMADEIKKTRDRLEGIIAKHCGKTQEQVHVDCERDNWLSAEEAKAYGLVDDIITSHRGSSDK